jgi:hypothetical protein
VVLGLCTPVALIVIVYVLIAKGSEVGPIVKVGIVWVAGGITYVGTVIPNGPQL